MTESDPNGVDHDILEALRRDARGNAPRASRERVLQRLTVGTAVLGAATTAATGGAIAAVTTAKATLALVSTLVLGVGIGFGTRSVMDTSDGPPANPQHVAPRAPTRAQATPPSSALAPADGPAPERAPVNPTPDLPRSTALPSTPNVARTTPPSALPTPSPEPAGLAAQQALLDEARAALRRREGANALSAIDAHRLRFPESALSEERAALEIRALAELGRMNEARGLHERFVLRFPHSLFTRSLSRIVTPRTDDSVTEPGALPQMKSGGNAAP